MYPVAAILLCVGVGAQSAMTDLTDRIARQRAAIADAAPDERAAIVESMLDLRAQLIRDHPDDPHQPLWLADQAQDLFYLVLPTDASGLVARFGLPTPRQRSRVRRVAREMNDFASRAETMLEQVIMDVEAGRAGGLDPTLFETERNRRVPFLRGIGACLDADFNVEGPKSRHALYAIAESRLGPVAEVLPERFAATAVLYAGLALLGVEKYDDAAKMLWDVSTDPLARRNDVFAAQLALTRCRAAVDVQDALTGLDEIETNFARADEPLLRVLIADERFRLLQRQGRVTDAFGAYLALARSTGTQQAALRTMGYSRLVIVAGPDTPLKDLPELVSVARAGNLASSAGGRTEAIELYERLLADARLDDTTTATAMFGLARVYLDTGNTTGAVRQLTKLARVYPASTHAEASIELAASLAAELYRLAPGDAGQRSLLREVLEILLGRYPNLASVDRWRYRAGCLALDEQRFEDAIGFFDAVGVDAGVRADALYRHAESLRRWAASTAGTAMQQVLARRLLVAAAEAEAANGGRRSMLARFRAEGLLAIDDPAGALAALADGDDDEFSVLVRIDAYRAMGRRDEMARELQRLVDMTGPRAAAALVAMFKLRQRELQGQLDIDRESVAAAEARRELLPLAQAASHWLEIHGRNETLQLSTADAYRLAGRCNDALRHYDELLADHPDALEVLYGRAECLYDLGGARDEEAMDHYRRLAVATATALDDVHWQSQLRMLQILRRTGRNTHRIAPYIQQLRSKDPELGGARYRREFERLLQ